MKNTYSVLFYIKRSKLLKNGEAPIYMRLTVNGEIVEVSLRQTILPKNWDSVKNKARGKGRKNQIINELIDTTKVQLLEYRQSISNDRLPLTASGLKRMFLGDEVVKNSLIEVFDEHNNEMAQLIGKGYTLSTLGKFQTTRKHVLAFNEARYKKNDILLIELDYRYIEAFEKFLLIECNCKQNSATKHVKALKKIVRRSVMHNMLDKNPFDSFQLKHETIERISLDQQELDIIENKTFLIDRLSVVRDLFVFQCYTGLSYSDLQTLTSHNIVTGIDGHKWIHSKRKKTGVVFNIPLLPKAEAILDKYADSPKVVSCNSILPVITNQKVNAYLKEIGTICDIRKNLHSHLARHTFATTITLSNNVPLETVSKLLGHSKIQTTQIYAKVLETKVSKEFEFLRKKY